MSRYADVKGATLWKWSLVKVILMIQPLKRKTLVFSLGFFFSLVRVEYT